MLVNVFNLGRNLPPNHHSLKGLSHFCILKSYFCVPNYIDAI